MKTEQNRTIQYFHVANMDTTCTCDLTIEIYKRFLANIESVVKVLRSKPKNLYALLMNDDPSLNLRLR